MSDTQPPPLNVKAPVKTKGETYLEESFYKALASQGERLDKFALELIKLQLAVPALYAALLALTEATAKPSLGVLLIIFVPWLIALALSFLAVFPAQLYQVKTTPIIEPLPKKRPQQMAMNAYFHFTAQRKFYLLAGSSALSFWGIAFAVFHSFL